VSGRWGREPRLRRLCSLQSLLQRGEIKGPHVLEFLALRDEYSETELEAALVAQVESFLLELGGQVLRPRVALLHGQAVQA
jgi:predicted nuclease of restriction endonuclease-like (RecB) superfamily